MYVDKPEPSSDLYDCKIRINNSKEPQYEPVCTEKVVIGFKPKEPLNFSCVSQNWENLTCTWVPAPNHVTTRFSLGYQLPGRAGGRTTFNCPESNSDQLLPPNTCMWDALTDPPYRMVHENFKFLLRAENLLGTNVFTYQFHHWANVIPAKPVGLSIVRKTSSSALLRWNIPYPMGIFPLGLYHKVSYRSALDSKESWKTEYIRTAPRQDEKYFNLTNLRYANIVYDVKVFSKSASAVGEDSWIQSSDISFRTSATLPGKAPKTDIGSFEFIRDNDDKTVLYVYWQTIPLYLENGDQFRYEVLSVEENGKMLNLKPDEITRTYAKFTGINLYADYKIEIVAINCKGTSEEKATINVSSFSKRPWPPNAVTKITFDGSLYGLRWRPTNSSDIVDQTIFWCENDSVLPNQCTGYLDWVHVGPNISEYNVAVSDSRKTYRFAIAANTREASSGMSWYSHSVSYDKSIPEVDGVWKLARGPDMIEFGFTMRYLTEMNPIEGFHVYYCPVSENDYRCEDPEMIRIVSGNVDTTSVVLTGLSPDTSYKVSVAPFTMNEEVSRSDLGLFSTSEAPPIPQESQNECVMKQSELSGALKRALNAQNDAAKAQRRAMSALKEYKRSLQQLVESCERSNTKA